MDPITAALTELVATVGTHFKDPAVRVQLISAAMEDVPAIARVLRAAEWDSDNDSPYLIYQSACTNAGDMYPVMAEDARAQYALLRDGLAAEEVELPELPSLPPRPLEPLETLRLTIESFTAATSSVLRPPVLCWLPTNIASDDAWTQSALELVGSLWNAGVRFILLAPAHGRMLGNFDQSAPTLRTVEYAVDPEATKTHFAQLFAPPSTGRADGTLPGSAAPDVTPPRRLKPGPTESESREELRKAGIEGVLLKSEAERLRSLVIEAAHASQQGDAGVALSRQSEACMLCEGAGARLELVMMLMMLASYQLQFGRQQESEDSYRRAEDVAGALGAYPQLTQARLGLAYLLLAGNRVPEAGALYEQAAASAIIGGVNLLTFEALRLAGICHQRMGLHEETILCWDAALGHARRFGPDEVRMSNFTTVAADLRELLQRAGRHDHANRIGALVRDVGAAGREGARQ